eukprot:scaffold123095_cov16-Tisochrysis_lutea.AAC.1
MIASYFQGQSTARAAYNQSSLAHICHSQRQNIIMSRNKIAVQLILPHQLQSGLHPALVSA